jgi:valyl-tRNA synthetase
LAATYDPEQVERGWQAYWQEVVTQHAPAFESADERKSKTFSMILPPPNVTGALHIGHALTITIQDAIARWHRMRGFDVRWLPGLDHAGIATQSVVERKLLKESGLTRHDLGRESFVDEVWRWNEQYGGRIMEQIDHLGAIVKKDQSYFTLDDARCVLKLWDLAFALLLTTGLYFPHRSTAVVDAFVQLYERGLIYRRRRMVNWYGVVVGGGRPVCTGSLNGMIDRCAIGARRYRRRSRTLRSTRSSSRARP